MRRGRSVVMLGLVALGTCGSVQASPELLGVVDRNPRASMLWATASASRPDLDAFIAERAAEARKRGLLPVVHLKTTWNAAAYLTRMEGHPSIRRALAGVYLIEVSLDDGASSGQAWRPYAMLCGNYAQTYVAVDERGRPATPVGSPLTKWGPATPEAHARFLITYLNRVRMRPTESFDVDGNRDWCAGAGVPWDGP